jgi:hypothetical protein
LAAQHAHPGTHSDSAESPTVPVARMGSGTSWLPDVTRMRALHGRALGWDVMLHGNAFLHYVGQSGVRRASGAGSTNWLMGSASRPVAGGVFRLRAHVSAEPATLAGEGYPLLLQTSQIYQGDLVTDRQHPHELLTEVAASYERGLGARVGFALYVAAAGEPAIGPVTYLHRPSALNDPLAPLGHHAQDVTHTTFGVVTAGVFTSRVKLEGSAFNGTHPDERRTGLELGGARLDSYAGRLTVNPGARWSISLSAARIAPSRGGAHLHGRLNRVGLSVLHTRPLGPQGEWASALVYGGNAPEDEGGVRGAWLIETNMDLDGKNAVFGRAEYVDRSPSELALTGSVSGDLGIGAFSLGYAREVAALRSWTAGLGVRGTVHAIPARLEPFYGRDRLFGLLVYARVRFK